MATSFFAFSLFIYSPETQSTSTYFIQLIEKMLAFTIVAHPLGFISFAQLDLSCLVGVVEQCRFNHIFILIFVHDGKYMPCARQFWKIAFW